jgi:hypothetical protein
MKKKLITILLTGLIFFTPSLWADTVYKSIDAQGNTVFTDLPTPDSQKIDIQPAQTYNLPPPSSKEEQRDQSDTLFDNTHYNVQILSPEDKHTFSTDIHSFTVSLSVEPSLRGGDKIQLLLNGEPYGSLYSTTDITITPDVRLARGSYQIQARVVSENNPSKIKGESATITFYQFRKSILVPH